MQLVEKPSRVQLHQILLVTEYPPWADVAVPYALGLAREHRARMQVVHQVPPHGSQKLMHLPRGGQYRQSWRDLVSEVAARQIVVDSDGISAQVQQMADRHDFDLIVVSVGRGEGASKRTVGKTLERVFDRADCPVLVIGPGIDRGVPLKTEPATILHATDFSPHAFAATQHAFSWAQEHQSWITLLHVVEGVRGATESERMRLQRPFREWMQELVPAELPIWCEVENRVAFGRPGEQIVQAAGELHADLIILGLNGMGTARQYSPGTTAREVIANASCPVLVVRDSMQQQEPVAAARRGGMRFAAMAA